MKRDTIVFDLKGSNEHEKPSKPVTTHNYLETSYFPPLIGLRGDNDWGVMGCPRTPERHPDQGYSEGEESTEVEGHRSETVDRDQRPETLTKGR